MHSDWDIHENKALICILRGLPKDERVASLRFWKRVKQSQNFKIWLQKSRTDNPVSAFNSHMRRSTYCVIWSEHLLPCYCCTLTADFRIVRSEVSQTSAGKGADLLKTGINAVSFLPVVYAVFSVFLTAQWRLRHSGSWGLTRVVDCKRE